MVIFSLFLLIVSPPFILPFSSCSTWFFTSFTIKAVFTLLHRFYAKVESFNNIKVQKKIQIEIAATILKNQATQPLKTFVMCAHRDMCVCVYASICTLLHTFQRMYACDCSSIIQQRGTFTFSTKQPSELCSSGCARAIKWRGDSALKAGLKPFKF